MRFIRAFGVIAGLAILAGSANAQSTVPPKLEGQKAIQAVIGSTIVFFGPNGRIVMFIAADHTADVLGKEKRETVPGSSKIIGSALRTKPHVSS